MLLLTSLGHDSALADSATRADTLPTHGRKSASTRVANVAAGFVASLRIPQSSPAELGHGRNAWPALRTVFGMPLVWPIAVIASCVAVGYKAVDYYCGYAYDVLAMSEADAAAFSTTASYILVVVAKSGGLLGARFGMARIVWMSFAVSGGCWRVLCPIP